MKIIPNKIEYIHVELTDKCNAECPICVRRFQGGHLNPIIKQQEISLDFFKLFDDEFLKNVKRWNFCGVKGDCVAATSLFDIVEFLLEKSSPNVVLELRTNGGYKSKKWWSKLGKLLKGTNSRVFWAIDGLEDTNHLYRKNVKWEKLWNNLMSYTESGGKSTWCYIPFKHNIHQKEEIQELCREYGFDFHLQTPHGFNTIVEGNKKYTQAIPVRNTDGEFLYFIEPADSEYEVHYSGQETSKSFPISANTIYNFEEIRGKEYTIGCKITKAKEVHHLDGWQLFPFDELYIDSDGAIIPCCFIASRYDYGDNQLEKMIGDRKNIILSEKNSLENILANTYYSKGLGDGITGNLQGEKSYCNTCLGFCGE